LIIFIVTDVSTVIIASAKDLNAISRSSLSGRSRNISVNLLNTLSIANDDCTILAAISFSTYARNYGTNSHRFADAKTARVSPEQIGSASTTKAEKPDARGKPPAQLVTLASAMSPHHLRVPAPPHRFHRAPWNARTRLPPAGRFARCRRRSRNTDRPQCMSLRLPIARHAYTARMPPSS